MFVKINEEQTVNLMFIRSIRDNGQELNINIRGCMELTAEGKYRVNLLRKLGTYNAAIERLASGSFN